MSLVLYYAPWSSASSCLWAVEELGVPCDRVKLDLAAKATHTPEFLAKNPNGKVPLLVHDGVPIFESVAILAHLGETFGVERKLFPAPGISRAQAFQWLVWTNVTLGAAVIRYLENHSEQVPSELRNAKVAERAKADVERNLAIVDQHLRDRTWLVGDAFSLADVHLAAATNWIGGLGFATSTLPSLEAWHARCGARPALAATMRG